MYNGEIKSGKAAWKRGDWQSCAGQAGFEHSEIERHFGGTRIDCAVVWRWDKKVNKQELHFAPSVVTIQQPLFSGF